MRLCSLGQDLPVGLTNLRVQFVLGLGHRNFVRVARTNYFEIIFRVRDIELAPRVRSSEKL